MHWPTNPTRSTRRGVTLIELLIVMLILMMVTAAAIPLMAPAVQNRRMREAARLISSYFSSARSRAIETGRPVGVMIERFNGQNFALNLSQVEVPQPYSGDSSTSRAIITNGGITNVPGSFPATDSGWTNLLRYGDQVKLDYKGALYTLASQGSLLDPRAGEVLTAPSAMNRWFLITPAGAPATNLPASYGTAGVPFQIFRQPVRSSAAPLQLPEGVAIDLLVSNLGTSANTLSNIDTSVTPAKYGDVLFNPVITFRPSGSVDYVTSPIPGPAPPPPTPPPMIGQGQRHPIGPIFLLLGRRELMNDVSKSQHDENLFDPSTTNPPNLHLQNFWIAIGPQTGQVTVAENAANTGPSDIANARRFALESQSIGGQ